MSSSRKNLSENWLLVEWKSGGRNVVYVRSVVNPCNKELKIGDEMTVNRRGEPEQATLIARAREREMLDAMIKEEEVAGPSKQGNQEEDEEDFSSSASSWVPSDDGAQSGDSAEIKNKKIKLEHYKRQYSNRRSSKKIITPSNKANAVLNIINRKRSHIDNQKNIGNMSMNKSVPDSTKRNQVGIQKVTIDARELRNIRNTFKILFKMLEIMKQPVNGLLNRSPEIHEESVMKTNEAINNAYSQLHQALIDQNKENDNDNSESDDFNRSDDNVLISNKYTNACVKTVQTKEAGNDEWVPIGSGKTLIHKDKFKQVNWRSYTIATRTLLLAVFPRRILATHSLTGKRSPAFQDKPAKMCLDPKIISDVIIEIMDRFNVRENLVRSIITTKCADECKMWKTRTGKKKTAKGQETSVSIHSQ